MDKGKSDWSWLPAQMPGVAKLMKDRRRQMGDAHVNECWKRGVVQGEPGWFFAWEGALAVGTPFDAEALVTLTQCAGTPRAAMLMTRAQETDHGAR